jgi:hypothetical protein
MQPVLLPACNAYKLRSGQPLHWPVPLAYTRCLLLTPPASLCAVVLQKYRDAAMIELEALNTLQANDPCQTRHCVQLLEWFNYRGHVCMVFERLGPSLYDILRRNGYKPFPFYMVSPILYCKPC